MRSILLICLGSTLSLISHSALAQTPQIIYVNKAASGSANGTSWTHAYPELRTALTIAASISGPKEIWVAQAEYKPTNDLNRDLSFVIPAQTFLYGGFSGNEMSKEGRNWRTNRTVLSGDLGKQFDKSDNSYHVVSATNVDQNAGLDGFVVKEGNAVGGSTGLGGGVLISSMISTTSPLITNCVFENNAAVTGGGLATYSQSGFAVSPQIVNCAFNGNSATSAGGAVFILAQVHATIFPSFINCSFSTNTSNVGGAAMIFGTAFFVNCTITANKSISDGPAFYNTANLILKNSIVWKNFKGTLENPDYTFQIFNTPSGANPVIQNNIVQGGFGSEADMNISSDPLFDGEASVIGKYPRTNIIPVSSTNMKYENRLEFNGPALIGPWPYYTFKDHGYNKIYMAGRNLQVLDFSNLVNNKPTSTVYSALTFPRTQRLEKSIHTAGNKIYFASYFSQGMFSVDRLTGAIQAINVLDGEPVTYDPNGRRGPKDLVVDDANNLLYCPVFYEPGSIFYGMLELNLTTQTKRWITPTSSPVSTGPVLNVTSDAYWGIHRILLDEQESVLYFSTGYGVWWWNRNTNATGLINSQAGITLAPGSPVLPSNITTGMFLDHTDNKLYIGTHAGLFVWDRDDNTTKVYNTENSLMMHNLVNTISKNEEKNLVYVACEDGGVFVINTVTGEEKLIHQDEGSEVHPQYMDNSAASVYYDATEKKLYASIDHQLGGVWIQDYNNLVPDFGDLRLKAGSPAIDRANTSFLPTGVTVDINGLNRLVDYASLFGPNSLDLGAYEKVFQEEEAPAPPIADNLGMNYVLIYSTAKEGIKDETTLDNFPVKDVNRSIQYIDGIGRPVQSIAIQGSPSKSDIVQPIVYDEFGREVIKYLPYTGGNDGSYKSNPVGTNSPQNNFYDGQDPLIAPDTSPFAKTLFEPSPLNRLLKQGAVGDAWQPAIDTTPDHSIKKVYAVNAQNEVLLFAYDGTTGTVSAIDDGQLQYFAHGQLFANATIDEHQNEVIEYTDKEGKLVLKKVQYGTEGSNKLYANTYYIYDDLENLVVVLPPEGVKQYLSISGQ